jgi:SOS-response transcriptional repressor LexA
MKMSTAYPTLPDGQGKIIEFIKAFMLKNIYSPSMEEIAEGIGVASTYGVRKQLNALMLKGWLTFKSKHQRTIQLTDKVHGGCCLLCGAKLEKAG